MPPDGMQMFATKWDLEFSVLSDFGDEVPLKYCLTFTVPEEVRPSFEAWGENSYTCTQWWLFLEIPLLPTYVINQEGILVWSFIDNDPGCHGKPDDIVAAIPLGICLMKSQTRMGYHKKRLEKVWKIVSKNCLGERRNSQKSFYCNFREYKYSHEVGLSMAEIVSYGAKGFSHALWSAVPS